MKPASKRALQAVVVEVLAGAGPHVVSTDHDRKSAEKRAKGVEYKGRETMSKRDQMNALLALYQQRHLPAISTKLTSDLLR